MKNSMNIVKKAEKLAKQRAKQAAIVPAKRAAEANVETEDAAGILSLRNKAAALLGLGRKNQAEKAEEDATSIHYASSEMYQGDVRLEIKSSEDFDQLNLFRECLKTVESLKIALNNWSEDEGLFMVVSLDKPVPLGHILSQMPMVAQIYQKRKNFVAVLNTPAVNQGI